MYIVKSEQPYIYKEQFGASKAAIYRAKRQKYLPVNFSTTQELSSVLSDAISGSGQWLKVEDLLFSKEDL